MDIKTLHKKYRDGEFTVESYISSLYDLIEKNNYNTYLTLNKEKALEKAKKLDEKIKNKAEISGLFGVPVAVKDNILTKNLRTTASSKSLKDFVPFFDAVIMERLKSTDAIIIGKTNMDEYAMGGSSETSYFGETINPFDNTVTPGGSSSGSGAALAAEEAVVAFGSDTGGSVRNPADFCHVMGFAPTYGAIPRYGVISMSNSLDRVGVMGTTVSDIRELFNIARGKSELDFTSLDIEEFNGKVELKDLKVAVIELKDEYNVNPQIKELFDETIEKLKSLGANIDIVSLNYLDLINDVYTVIMAIEVESNIAKIDGLRYGQTVEKYDSTEDFYVKNRTDNFGEEVRRRIALGNFFASKDNDQKYYKQAMKIRGAVRSQIDKLFENYDALITPTTIDLPKKVGESSADSYASFDVGMFNMLTNLSDIPSISIPMKEGVLGSIQIAGKRYDDMRLLAIAEEVEGGLK